MEKIDRHLKASERNALQVLLLESKLSSLRQGSALDKTEEGNVISNHWLHHTFFQRLLGAQNCRQEDRARVGPEAAAPPQPSSLSSNHLCDHGKMLALCTLLFTHLTIYSSPIFVIL